MTTRFEPGAVATHKRKKLPHWDATHGTQFISFHTAGVILDRRTAGVVAETLLHDDGTKYTLLAWCVMSDHVHVVLRTTNTIASIVKAWKSVSARKIRAGKVWQADYWDRLIRDSDELEKTITYVLQNPATDELEDWPYVKCYPDRI